MITADLKQNPDTTIAAVTQNFATAKDIASAHLKSLGIEDTSDLATSVGYLIVGSYALAMVLNLATLY